MEWLSGLVVVVLLLYMIIIYNGFVSLSKRADASWADIDVQLKRRYDLIPNLVQAVKAYAGHERSTLALVTEARSAAMGVQDIAGHARAEGQLTHVLHRMLALVEAYPDLKADDNFLDLQRQLIETEDTIQHARRYFNAVIRDYNTKVESFPDLVVARLFGYRLRDYFELESVEERQLPVVSA